MNKYIEFEDFNGRKIYRIPADSSMDDFKVVGSTITLATGDVVVFDREETAETAFCVIQDCLRKGAKECYVQEHPDLGWGVSW